jgi:hypothetical protein
MACQHWLALCTAVATVLTVPATTATAVAAAGATATAATTVAVTATAVAPTEIVVVTSLTTQWKLVQITRWDHCRRVAFH